MGTWAMSWVRLTVLGRVQCGWRGTSKSLKTASVKSNLVLLSASSTRYELHSKYLEKL